MEDKVLVLYVVYMKLTDQHSVHLEQLGTHSISYYAADHENFFIPLCIKGKLEDIVDMYINQYDMYAKAWLNTIETVDAKIGKGICDIITNWLDEIQEWLFGEVYLRIYDSLSTDTDIVMSVVLPDAVMYLK
jgi:hypothetical protein